MNDTLTPDGYRYAWQMPVSPRMPGKSSRRRAKITDRRDDWSEEEVFSRLERIFPSPAFVLLPQVANGTGQSREKRRTVDALAVSVYPSRGLYLAGIEIKITRSDWVKELREVEKASDIQRFCRQWYMACPVGVIPEGEVPLNWGLIVVRKDGATVVKPAVDLSPEPPDMPFMCAVLRAAASAYGKRLRLLEEQVVELEEEQKDDKDEPENED